jgi:hypothetical protein
MTRSARFALISCVSFALLACSLSSLPIPAARNLLATGEAVATTIPSTGDAAATAIHATVEAAATSIPATVESMATSIPSMAPGLPSIPDVSGFLNPTGTPVSEWNGIPVMSQATSGQEFTKSTYGYRVPLMDQAEIESFYDQKLQALGWKSEFSASTGAHGGILVFNKDSQVLTITVTTQDQDLLVLLILE